MRSPVIYLGMALSFLSCCCSLSKVSMRTAAAHPSSDCPLSTVFWFVLIAVVRLNAYTAGRRVTRLSPRLSPGRSLDHQFSVALRLMSVCLSVCLSTWGPSLPFSFPPSCFSSEVSTLLICRWFNCRHVPQQSPGSIRTIDLEKSHPCDAACAVHKLYRAIV